MILTEEEINSIHHMEMYFPTWKKAFARTIEQVILDKLQDKLKNAERYEWLRNTQRIGSVVCPENSVAQMWVDTEMLSDYFLDKAIDSAMGEKNVK